MQEQLTRLKRILRNRIITPPEWDERLYVHWRTQATQGLLIPIIDDEDMVFSKERTHDITLFFRHRELFNALAKLSRTRAHRLKILSAPSSVGCEAVSLACVFNRHGYADKGRAPIIHGVDISDKKIRAARSFVYPKVFGMQVPNRYKAHFNEDEQALRVNPEISRNIEYLDPVNLVDTRLQEPYDIALCMNLLCYLPDNESKRKLIENLAAITTSMICLGYGVNIKTDDTSRSFCKAVLKEQGFSPNSLFDHKLLDADIFVREISF